MRSSLDRSEVAGTLWESSSEERALGCLRTELWRINRQLRRRILDPAVPLRIEDVPDAWECGDLLPGGASPLGRSVEPIGATLDEPPPRSISVTSCTRR